MSNETYDMLEEAVQKELDYVLTSDLESKEHGMAVSRALQLVETLETIDKDLAVAYDDVEKRRIEEERNKAQNEIEREKQKVTLPRVGLEMAKLIVPLVVSFVGYNVFQKRVLRFEETGRITSTAGRELHLPKLK